MLEKANYYKIEVQLYSHISSRYKLGHMYYVLGALLGAFTCTSYRMQWFFFKKVIYFRDYKVRRLENSTPWKFPMLNKKKRELASSSDQVGISENLWQVMVCSEVILFSVCRSC